MVLQRLMQRSRSLSSCTTSFGGPGRPSHAPHHTSHLNRSVGVLLIELSCLRVPSSTPLLQTADRHPLTQLIQWIPLKPYRPALPEIHLALPEIHLALPEIHLALHVSSKSQSRAKPCLMGSWSYGSGSSSRSAKKASRTYTRAGPLHAVNWNREQRHRL